MHRQNKFRTSAGTLSSLEDIFNPCSGKQLRTTFSHSMAQLDISSFRTTMSHPTTMTTLPSEMSFQKPKQNLKKQLSALQEKIESAKKSLKLKTKPEQQTLVINQRITLDSAKQIPMQETSPDFGLKTAEEEGFHKYTNAEIKPKNVTSFIFDPYISVRHSKYYVTEAIRARHQKNSLAVEHIGTSIAILNSLLPALKNVEETAKQPIILTKKLSKRLMKTLILDLDETLIHCYDSGDCEPDLTLNIQIEGNPVVINFSIRPCALTFLKKMAKKWEIIIFTASHQDYANAILNELDPEGVIFDHRLYRQHCTVVGDMYVKDLSRLNRPLKDTVLVDNAAYSYSMQLNNGIPILPFYDGKDFQLSALQGYLQKLEHCSDVRDLNQQYFKLQQYIRYQTTGDLINSLYMEDNFD